MNKISTVLISLIFIASCKSPYKNTSNKKEVVVAIQPFASFPKKEVSILQKTIEQYYGVSTSVLSVKPFPTRFIIKEKSSRYRADSIIKHLKRIKPDSIDYVIGLTTKDISCTKRNASGEIKSPEHKYRDWGIFGLGYRPGPSCVVSSFRVKGKNSAHTLERLQKITLHELGHNIGLDHCPDEHCFMRDAAEKISTIDAVEMNLCEMCKREVNLPTE